MANKLFANYPKTKYRGQTVTDFTQRSAFFDNIKDDENETADYFIEEGETPTSLAQDLYADPYLFWIFFYINNIIDPFFDWPMRYADLQEWIENEYNNPDEIRYYSYDGQGYETDTQIQFLMDKFNNVTTEEELRAVPGVLGVTNRMHEELINDEKRFIRVLRPERIDRVIQQFSSVMKRRVRRT